MTRKTTRKAMRRKFTADELRNDGLARMQAFGSGRHLRLCIREDGTMRAVANEGPPLRSAPLDDPYEVADQVAALRASDTAEP